LQIALRVDDGGDHDLRPFHQVDDSLTVHDQFTNFLIVELWNLSATLWKVSEGSNSAHDVSDHDRGIGRRIVGNVGGYCFQVANSPL
jgi:hypothetical protein